jgi:hypothetical protein
MTETLLGEIMGNLMKVRAARFVFDRNTGHVSYELGRPHRILSYKYVRYRLTRQAADHLINAVCDRAAKLNRDAHGEFIYRTIYLFGSWLTNKELPADVDIALEIQYAAAERFHHRAPYLSLHRAILAELPNRFMAEASNYRSASTTTSSFSRRHPPTNASGPKKRAASRQ